MKNHLAQTWKDVKPCLKVSDDHIKNYFAKLLEKVKKINEQLDDDFHVECLQKDLQNIDGDN